MSLQFSNITAQLFHDCFGNVFLSVDDASNISYAFTIDKNNDIEVFDVDLTKLDELISDDIVYDKIINVESTSLKKKILDDIEGNEDSDQEEDFQNFKDKIKYLEEDKYLFVQNNEIESENAFKFYKMTDNSSIQSINRGFKASAIYDTYIRDKNKNVIASLISETDENYYRISFYNDGNISLNIIGDAVKNYMLEYNNNTTSLRKV